MASGSSFSRRTLLKALAFAATSPWRAALADEESLSFVVLSDTHIGRPGDAARLQGLLPLLARERPAFLLHAGDVVDGTVAARRQVEEAQKLLARLPAKVLLVPGNHDVGMSRGPALLAAWRKAFGPTESTIRLRGWRAIGFNSSALTRACGDRAQRTAVLDFLARELAGAKESNERVALLHHLPEVIVPYRGQTQAPWAEEAVTRFSALLTEFPPTVRFAGHWHVGVRVPGVAGSLTVAPAVSNMGQVPSGYLRCTWHPSGRLEVEQIIVDSAGARELPAMVRLFALPRGAPPA
ncbi:MAG: metallophosphoesterase [Deltaproteobacteria bacterium]|nr:metallophosphoesterase [Deltaproteobacteria bacterium]